MKLGSECHRLTHAAGLVFAHHEAPIHRLEALAKHELAEGVKGWLKTRYDSKDSARKLSPRDPAANRFDYEVLESFDHLGGSLERYRKRRFPAWLNPEDFHLPGTAMAAIAQQLRALARPEKGEPFPARQLHMNVHKPLAPGSRAPTKEDFAADKLEPELRAYAPQLTALAGFIPPAALWFHLAALWDYVARTPQSLCAPTTAPRLTAMPAFTLNVTLTLTGPVLTAATAPGGYGLDAVFARNPMPPTDANGQPVPGEHFILPESLVRGRLRQAWEELNSVFRPDEPKPFDIEALLGPDPVRGNQGSNPLDTNEPLRGRLRFEDFRACPATTGIRARHRIAIDTNTGTAGDQMLQLLEAPWGSGATVQFTGAIRCVAKDENAAKELARQVEVGLRWVPQFGGERGLGFGANAGVSVSVKPSAGGTTPPSTAEAANATAWVLVITPLAPFLLARHRTIENVFEGQEIIPGAAFKGALAELWREEAGAAPGTPVSQFGRCLHPELAEHFDALVFSHACPAPKGRRTRPVVPPLSLARAGDLLRDLVRDGGPGLLKRESPTFDIDWKSRDDVDREFGWPDLPLPREPRLGTAIDREKNRTRDEALCGKEAVIPTGYEWLARVDFSAVTGTDVRAKVAVQLAALLAGGLEHLGKTRARAQVEVLPAGSITPHVGQTLEPVDGQVIVNLQTPALLGWPEPLPPFPGVDTGAWKTTYAEVWAELSNGALTCLRHFARQSLAGGEYLWRRFQKKRGRPYNPWPLTDAGSVFVLQVTGGREADAQAFLQRIAARGLPLPAWTRTAFDLKGDPKTDWCFCPYLPENGYGEVALNLAPTSASPRWTANSPF